MNHYQFLTHSVARAHVVALAERLGWPRATYRSLRAVELEGEWPWRTCGLSDPAARRDLMQQLLSLEHEQMTLAHEQGEPQ